MSESRELLLNFRRPQVADAAAVWNLVRETGVLDQNSAYAYLLLFRDFADTCLVADDGGTIAGFVTGYRPPERPDVLFVWQIGVSPAAQRRGLGRRLLSELVGTVRRHGSPVDYIEATISPSNAASRRLFERLADDLGVPFHRAECFLESHFPAGGHEEEPLIRIGPLSGC